MKILLIIVAFVAISKATILNQRLSSTNCRERDQEWLTCRDNRQCGSGGVCTNNILPDGGVCEFNEECKSGSLCQENSNGIPTCNGEDELFTYVFTFIHYYQ